MFQPHDGRRVRVAPYRRMMLFLMRGRNESAVYFEQRVDVSRALTWLAAWNERHGTRATPFHLVLHALASVLHERDRLNRFTLGRRTFQRRGVFLSFAVKKQRSDDAPLATVKRRFDPAESFEALVRQLTGEIAGARDVAPSAMDKELSVLLAIPSPILSFLIGLLRRLYAIGLAPRKLIDTDPLYTSAFVANLGSIGLDAAYHHLYEHGTCPLFVTVGKITDGTMPLRYTFDERVEDGLYCARSLELLARRLEDPAAWLEDEAAGLRPRASG